MGNDKMNRDRLPTKHRAHTGILVEMTSYHVLHIPHLGCEYMSDIVPSQNNKNHLSNLKMYGNLILHVAMID